MVVITVAGVVASCLSAALWGFYPVLARYLMHGQLSGINPPATSVLAIVCFWNTMIVGSYYAYVKLIRKPRHTSIASEDDIKEKNNGKDKNNDEEEDTTDTDADTATSAQKMKVAFFYGMLCLSRMVTNMQSVNMTKAYLTQMTGMSLPFFTAFLAYILLHEKIHNALYPAVFVMIIGSLIVLLGQGAFDVNDDGFTIDDVYGILLQLVSVVLSAMLKIAFKSTEGTLDTVELLLVQFSVSAVPLLIYSYLFERLSLYYVLYGLEIGGWLALAGISIGIYMFGNYLQIYAVRAIGASNHSASNGIRLVSAVGGSSLILKEHMKGVIGYFGCLLILFAVTFYWYSVHFCKVVATNSSVAVADAAAEGSSDGDIEIREQPTLVLVVKK